MLIPFRMRCLPVPQTRTQLAHGPMLLNAARAEMCRPPIHLACVRSVLPVEQLGALARHRPRGWRSQRSRRARRPLAEGAVGEASRADRCLAGGTARGGRPDPRLRPLTRGRPLPRPPCGRRDRRKHDRHDVPASSDDRRTAAQPARSRACAATTIWRFASRTRSPAAQPSGLQRRSRAGCNARCGDLPAKVSTHTRATRRRASTSTA